MAINGDCEPVERGMRELPIPGVFATRWHKQFQAFAADRRGVAAVEFAMIAIPFFFLIFGLLEVCVIFIMSSILEHAANEASRQIRTGQLQTDSSYADADARAAEFRADLCKELYGLMSCAVNDDDKADRRLKIDVQKFDSFSGTGSSTLTYNSDDRLDNSGFGFAAGAQNEIVVIRVFYEWDLMVPVLSAPLKNPNLAGNQILLQTTVAFRNEPFGNSGGG